MAVVKDMGSVCHGKCKADDASLMTLFGTLRFKECLCDCLSEARKEEESVEQQVRGMSREQIEEVITTAIKTYMTPPTTLRRLGEVENKLEDIKSDIVANGL